MASSVLVEPTQSGPRPLASGIRRPAGIVRLLVDQTERVPGAARQFVLTIGFGATRDGLEPLFGRADVRGPWHVAQARLASLLEGRPQVTSVKGPIAAFERGLAAPHLAQSHDNQADAEKNQAECCRRQQPAFQRKSRRLKTQEDTVSRPTAHPNAWTAAQPV